MPTIACGKVTPVVADHSREIDINVSLRRTRRTTGCAAVDVAGVGVAGVVAGVLVVAAVGGDSVGVVAADVDAAADSGAAGALKETTYSRNVRPRPQSATTTN